MKCTNCGTEFSDGIFCPECGTRIEGAVPETSVDDEIKRKMTDFELEQKKKEHDWELERKRKEAEVEIERKRIENAQLDLQRKEAERKAAELDKLEKERVEAEIALNKEKAAMARIERQKAEAEAKAERNELAAQKRKEQAPHTYGIVSLILGIISIIFGGTIVVTQIIGIVFAIKSKKDGKMTTAGKSGMICNILAFVVVIAILIIALCVDKNALVS